MMHQPICVCENPLCPADTGRFFVTVVDADRTGFLLGPYPTHEQALADVDRGRDLAYKADGKAWFYAYGTARVRDGVTLPRAVFRGPS